MPYTDTELKTVASLESIGKSAVISTIQVGIDRDLTDEENRFIHKCNTDIHDLLCRTNYELDPETGKIKEEQKAKLLACFDNFIYSRPVMNLYTGNAILPWYEVTTCIGIITIGWRHRVIVIDWKNSEQHQEAETLFPNEDTTMFDWSIHAWGYEKAKEYLKTIHNIKFK